MAVDTSVIHAAAHTADAVVPVVQGFWDALYTVFLGIGVIIGVIGKMVHSRMAAKKAAVPTKP